MLARLIVLKSELAEQFIGIIGSDLHGDDASGVF